MNVPNIPPEKAALCESLGARLAAVIDDEINSGVGLNPEEAIGVVFSLAVNTCLDGSSDLDIIETFVCILRACRANRNAAPTPVAEQPS